MRRKHRRNFAYKYLCILEYTYGTLCDENCAYSGIHWSSAGAIFSQNIDHVRNFTVNVLSLSCSIIRFRYFANKITQTSISRLIHRQMSFSPLFEEGNSTCSKSEGDSAEQAVARGAGGY